MMQRSGLCYILISTYAQAQGGDLYSADLYAARGIGCPKGVEYERQYRTFGLIGPPALALRR